MPTRLAPAFRSWTAAALARSAPVRSARTTRTTASTRPASRSESAQVLEGSPVHDDVVERAAKIREELLGQLADLLRGQIERLATGAEERELVDGRLHDGIGPRDLLGQDLREAVSLDHPQACRQLRPRRVGVDHEDALGRGVEGGVGKPEREGRHALVREGRDEHDASQVRAVRGERQRDLELRVLVPRLGEIERQGEVGRPRGPEIPGRGPRSLRFGAL